MLDISARPLLENQSPVYLHFRETKSCGTITWRLGHSIWHTFAGNQRAEYIARQFGDDPIAKLENLYREGNTRVKEEETALHQARQELVKLQEGDPENLSLWEKIRDISMSSFQNIYDLLDVRFDHSLGKVFTGIKWKRYTTD